MTTMISSSKAAIGSRASWGWQCHSFRAMDTDVYAQIYADGRWSRAGEVEDLFRYFEGLLSRFRPTSELSRLNDHDGQVFIASQDLFAAVEAAIWAAQQTGGIYDPTILPALEAAGYDRTFAAIGHLPAVQGAPAGISGDPVAGDPRAATYDHRQVWFDRFTRAIVRPLGLRLDLGGMGKGWTVDRVADGLIGAGPFLLNAGGDLYAYGHPYGARGWPVHLAHPLEPRRKLMTLILHHHAVATSTIARRRWLMNGRVHHHLIDPRTGRPAITDAVSVSVVGRRVFTAEVHAKTALILGSETGLEYLESLPDVEGLIFTTSGACRMTTGLAAMADPLHPAGYEMTQGE